MEVLKTRGAGWRVLLLVIVCILTSATLATAAYAAKPDACVLLTAADFQKQFGQPFNAGEPEPPSCRFEQAFGATRSFHAILHVSTASSVKAAKQVLKDVSTPQTLSSGAKRTAKKVKGVGNDARYWSMGGGDDIFVPQINVRVGKVVLQLDLFVSDTNQDQIEDKPAAIALAKVAVGRL